MSFRFFCEHDLEALAESFSCHVYNRAGEFSGDAADLLKAEIAVVQTRGISEYLRQVLAARNKIAANLETPFLNNYINNIFRRFYGAEFAAAEKLCDPQNMRCSIMKLLGDESFVRSRVPQLKKYISGVNSELKRWQLAGKVADLFDQYQLYRARNLDSRFFNGQNGNWQWEIYREIFDENNQQRGRDYFFRKFLTDGLTAEQAAQADRTVSVFGVGTLPPVYLDIFTKLAGYCDVNFFYLTVCLEYWEDNNPRKPGELRSWQPPQSANPVLTALGSQGRGFFAALMNNQITENLLDFGEYTTPDDYPAASTMLDIMHYDILHMFNRRNDSPEDEFVGTPRPDLNGDRSIAIHNCHSIRRELEVLQDELLHLIRSGTPPEKILVMAPDIVKCAPVINAVFGSGPLADVYSIADLPPVEAAEVSEVFKHILSTAGSRFEFSEIISLLDLPLISRALNLIDGDLAKYAGWLQQAGARWGYDDKMRGKFCAGNICEYSWQEAFERLLTGFACRNTGGEASLINDVLALEAIEGEEIEIFARIVRLIGKLALLSEEICKKLKISQWCDIFENIIGDFFPSDNAARRAVAPLRAALKKLRDADDGGFLPGTYPLNAALAMLEDYWTVSGENGQFLRGRITFCRMVPMRSIPMDAVALLNLNEGEFPRRQTDLGFDLIAMVPQPGDRSLPQQDRYLLLEAIMAARKNLLFFYCGQSAKDNELCPACAPLNEIADYLQSAFDLQEIKHPISGINEFYYVKDSAGISFAADNYAALLELRQRNAVLQENSLALPTIYRGIDDAGEIYLDDLVKFFSNPAEWMLVNNFGIYNNKFEDGFSDMEVWSLEKKDFWRVNQLLIKSRLHDADDDQAINIARKSSILPPGELGKHQFEKHASRLSELPREWADWLQNAERRPVSCTVGTWHLTGSVNMSCDGSKVLNYSWSSYKAKTAAEAVLGTLAAAVTFDTPVSGRIINIPDYKFETRIIDEITPEVAREKLQRLLEYASAVRNYPPMLFPKSSVHYQASKSEVKTQFYNFRNFCDCDDPNIKLFYSAEDWNDEFLARLQSEAAIIYDMIREEDV